MGVAGALLFAWLPVMIYGYNFPPCIQLVNICDPLALENSLAAPFGLRGYYGHYPAVLLGMHVYYRMVPALVFLGLWVLLKRYGWITPVLAWVVLFLIARGIAFDMRNGTFVGIINFYLWGFILARVVARWVEGKDGWHLSAVLAGGMVFFHAFTGLVAFTGVMLHWVWFRKPPVAFAAALLGVSVLISFTLLPSSISRLENMPVVAANTITPIDSDIGRFVDYPRMGLAYFSKVYVGEGLLLFTLLAAIVYYFAYKKGWRLQSDVALMILAMTCLPLLIMTFTPIALNADRTAKLLVGIIAVLATVIVTQGLRHLNKWQLWGASGVMLGGSLIYELPQIIPYWMQMGSYQ